MHKFLLFLLLLGLTVSISAQTDSLQRSFDAEQLEGLKNSGEYIYEGIAIGPQKKIQPPDSSFLRSLGLLLIQIVGFLTSVPGIICLLFVIAVLLFIGFRRSYKKNVNPSKGNNEITVETQIRLDDSFDQLREKEKQALEKEDFRLAIRYHFIILLKQLHGAGLIKFDLEKTNRQYLFELPAKLQTNFKTVSRIFEYTWYGEYKASKQLYEHKVELTQQLKPTKDVA